MLGSTELCWLYRDVLGVERGQDIVCPNSIKDGPGLNSSGGVGV